MAHMKLGKILCAWLAALMLMLSFTSCAGSEEPQEVEQDGWVSIWATAAQLADMDQIPTEPSLKENTCRQVIRASIAGDKIRLTFSNQYGNIPLELDSVHIAKLLYAGSPEIDVSTDTVVTFNGGSESISIEPGMTATSDEIDFSFEALDLLAVSAKFGKYIGSSVTCHKESYASAWVCEGDHVSDQTLSGVKVMGSWYYLVGADTWAPAGTKAIVALGDSITDGVGASTNTYTTWPNQLDELLKSNPDTANISVVNMGISGNVLLGEWGETAKNRLERDVLSVPGVKYCILLIGINDIGGAQEDISEDIIADYKEIIETCHANGIEIYAGTLTPVKGNFYYSELHEKIRLAVNDFVMSPDSGFDGYIDFSASIAREDDPAQMKDEYNCSWGDFLHPGDLGYEQMGKEAYESLLTYWAEPEQEEE